MWGQFYSHVILLIFANIFNASCKEKGTLTFVIDTTLSMTDDIDRLKDGAVEIAEIVSDNDTSRIQNMALVTFNDPGARVETVTKNRHKFIEKIENISIRGSRRNLDCEEPSINAVLLALENSLPRSFIYVFTDASAKDLIKARQVINVCQEKQSKVYFVLTGFCHSTKSQAFQVYYDIAEACSGSAFYVNSLYLSQVLTTIKETIRSNNRAIATARVRTLKNTNVSFEIANLTEYAIITTFGFGVSLKVHGPKAGQEPDSNRLIWLNNVKVLKLSDPAPGNYTATVRGILKTSINVVARTEQSHVHHL